MPSSLFSSPKRYYKRPAICIAMKTPYPLLDDPFSPPSLQAGARTADFDPPIEFDFATAFEIHRRATGPYYSGSSAQADFRHHLYVTRIDPVGRWIAQLTAELGPWGQERFYFEFFVEPLKNAWGPVHIQRTTIPGKDFQRLHLQA